MTLGFSVSVCLEFCPFNGKFTFQRTLSLPEFDSYVCANGVCDRAIRLAISQEVLMAATAIV